MDLYYNSPTFIKYCGRDLQVFKFDSQIEEYPGLKEALSVWPHERAMLKFGSRKAMPVEEFDGTYNGWCASDMFMLTLHSSADLLVQEYIPMEFEYRMFVTNGVVRTGAGNVEYHTPLDNPERKQFFTQLERKRNSGEELSDEAELVSRYVKFGQAVADELATEGFLDYTLDVAVNADTGEVVVIEMNSLTNSGLYACDPVRILEGLHC